MAITIDRLINDDRFSGDNVIQFLLYLPFGLILLATRTVLALLLWISSIILPNKSSVRQLLSIFACCTFGVYVKLKGKRDPRCSLLVANYVSALDSLAASHVMGTISLRKWKVPPFFASTLGIRNAAQFVRKQHFTDNNSQPVLLQPEGGPTNGKGLLKFTDWPFQIGNKIQPVAITAERPFTHVCVHGPGESNASFPWSDALWFLWTPVTVYHVTLLPALDRGQDDDEAFVQRIRQAIADALQVEVTEYRWEQLQAPPAPPAGPAPAPGPAGPAARAELQRLAARVKDVLPHVPVADILRDLGRTRSVDVTITNFLEGVTPFVAETPETSGASGSGGASGAGPSRAPPSPTRYVIPTPTGVFPDNARDRQLSFQERKAQMIAVARQRYIEKHGLKVC